MRKLANKIGKEKKGFTTSEVVVAIIIIVLFVGVISTGFYNYYMSVQSKNRTAQATSYLIDVIENVQKMNYEDVSQESVNQLLEEVRQNQKSPSGYTLTAVVSKYNEQPGKSDKKDLIKILQVRIDYSVGKQSEKVETTTLVTK